MNEVNQFTAWGLVEVMGHNRYAGEIGEQTIAGHGYIRVDVPATTSNGAFTKFLSHDSIFGITPLDEQIARAMAEEINARPIQNWDIRALYDEIKREARAEVEREERSDRAAKAIVDQSQPDPDDVMSQYCEHCGKTYYACDCGLP